jgi:hypothetical protein
MSPVSVGMFAGARYNPPPPPVDDLTGLKLFLRSADLGTPGTLNAWPDVSEAAHAISYAGTHPTIVAAATDNGNKAVDFNGAAQLIYNPTGLPVLTASSMYSGLYDPQYAADDNNSTYWHSLTTAMPQWISAQLATPAVATGYRIAALNGSSSGPGTFVFQGAMAATPSTWVDLDSQSGLTWAQGQSRDFTISNTVAYTHYRVYITAAPEGYLRMGTYRVLGVAWPVAGTAEQRDGEFWIKVKSSLSSGNNNGCFQMGSSGQSSHYGYSGLIYEDCGRTSRPNFVPSLTLNAWRTYRVRVSSTAWSAYLNGALQSTTGLTAADRSWPNAIRIGGSSNGTFSGLVAAALASDHLLSSTEEASVAAYFNSV